jgi:hypothetical protein
MGGRADFARARVLHCRVPCRLDAQPAEHLQIQTQGAPGVDPESMQPHMRRGEYRRTREVKVDLGK